MDLRTLTGIPEDYPLSTGWAVLAGFLAAIPAGIIALVYLLVVSILLECAVVTHRHLAKDERDVD